MGLRKLINKVINMKKTILLIFIAIVIALIITAIAIYTYIDNTLGVSKDFAVEIKQNDIADHQYIQLDLDEQLHYPNLSFRFFAMLTVKPSVEPPAPQVTLIKAGRRPAIASVALRTLS
jgi:cell division protein FtsL